MRFYEVVFLVHPDQSEQVPHMLDRYRAIVEQHGGTVHLVEDWGRRQLAYPINKIHKAHYAMLNIEANTQAVADLEESFKFNDAVLRNMVLKVSKAQAEQSQLSKEKDEDDKQKAAQAARHAAKEAARSASPEDAAPEDAEAAPAVEETPTEVAADAAADSEA